MKIAKSGSLISILLILGVLSVASLGTFAYFNDVETSGGNVFMAGTLDLEVSSSSSLPITFTNMAPGDGMGGAEHGLIKYNFYVKNVGTLNGTLTITVKNVKNYENGRNEPELAVDTTGGVPGLGNGELGQYLIMQINWPGNPGFRYVHGGGVAHSANCGITGVMSGARHTINCWENVAIQSSGFVLEPGKTYAAGVLEFMLPTTVGNVIQSDSVVFDIEFRLDQAL